MHNTVPEPTLQEMMTYYQARASLRIHSTGTRCSVEVLPASSAAP
ncbi:MAG TPA: hypothetical protein VKV19_10445 [Ktedonobacteraceae bacterium]|nr:hypothetical protein [Ktedonobacteraceae bacterium]